MKTSSLPIPPPSVFDSNTQAVVSLRAGRFDEATRRLRETLVHTRSLLEQDGSTATLPQQMAAATTTTTTTDMDGQSPAATSPPLSLFTVALTSESSCATEKYLPLPSDSASALCPIFNKAFVVATEDEDCLLRNQPCQNITISTVLYNLGLTHHMIAITQGKSNELQVALNLYTMALSMLENGVNATNNNGDEDQQQQPEECHNMVLLLLAIFNNMANVHAHNFNRRETRSCLDCLKEIVNSYTYSQPTLSAQDEEDHFFFYLNLFVTAPADEFALAPAA